MTRWPGVGSPASSRKISFSCACCTRWRRSRNSLLASCSGVSVHSSCGVSSPDSTRSRSAGLDRSLRLKCSVRACVLYALLMAPWCMYSCDSISAASARSRSAPVAAATISPSPDARDARNTSAIFLRCSSMLMLGWRFTPSGMGDIGAEEGTAAPKAVLPCLGVFPPLRRRFASPSLPSTANLVPLAFCSMLRSSCCSSRNALAEARLRRRLVALRTRLFPLGALAPPAARA
mmetsp:Transcript_6576/g.26811  ORF Transcript_6576/g.26811 Transcript_6576/m.26811 type:complete len:233 (-) Transcript_6576:732-1430(-)